MLAAAQASPPTRAALDGVVGEVWPGSRAERIEPLAGGLGSVLHRIDLVGAPVASVVLRQLLVEFGDDADTVRREAEVHRAGAAAGVAMPVVHWSDPEGSALGRPALLLEHVPGHPILADLATATGQAAMAATLHAVAGVPTQTLAHLPRLATLDDVVTRFWPPPVTSEVVDAAALNAAVDAAVGAFEPGDALLHMDLQEDLWHLIIKTNRVTGFVGRKHHEENRYIPPIPLSNEELMAIKEQIDSGFQQASVEEEFVREQKVMITEGPFSNFSGVIDEISHERGKLKVLVSIFGRPTPVEVDFDKVVKA